MATLRARIIPRFPARVVAGTGMSITQENGVYTFNTDIDETGLEQIANKGVADGYVGNDADGLASTAGVAMSERGAPTNPTSGTARLYIDTSGHLHVINDTPENITLQFAGSATSYSPAITSETGTLTSASANGAYRKIGRLVFVEGAGTITTVGTGAGALNISLPFTANSTNQAVQTFSLSDGVGCSGLIQASTSAVKILKYDGSTIIAAARTILFTGWYEAVS